MKTIWRKAGVLATAAFLAAGYGLGEVQNVFGEHVYEMNLDSTKSMTGHMIGATGAVESLACIMALKDGIVPPTINHAEDDLDEQIDYRINFTFDNKEA